MKAHDAPGRAKNRLISCFGSLKRGEMDQLGRFVFTFVPTVTGCTSVMTTSGTLVVFEGYGEEKVSNRTQSVVANLSHHPRQHGPTSKISESLRSVLASKYHATMKLAVASPRPRRAAWRGRRGCF